MGFSLFPKNVKFFEYFSRQQKLLAEAADALLALCSSEGEVVAHCARLHALEADGNQLVREISRLLAETFITPIDREDVYRIANGYEEILNQVRSIGVRIGLFRPGSDTRTLQELAGDFRQMTLNCGTLLEGIATDKYTAAPMDQVISTKAGSDRLLLVAMGELHENAKDGDSMLTAQILDRCETLLVATERFASTLEAIGIKNA